MLTAEVRQEIAGYVRMGFYDKDRLLSIFCEEMYEPGQFDAGDISTAIDQETASWDAEKKNWPAVTDCDRLNQAFDALKQRGVYTLQNAGNTQSDGYADFCQLRQYAPDPAAVIGYCFYHGQDLERVVRGEGLYLAFGPTDPEDEETKGAIIGNIVREELERVGLKVTWNGAFNKRMVLPNFVWRRR